MANVSAYRFVGPTTAIAVTGSSSTSVTINPNGNDQVNFCGFLNTSANPVAITIAPAIAGTTTTANPAILPTGGNSSQSFVLGVSMSQPTVIAVPPSFAITTIGTSGTTLYVMPMVDQN
jgi:hypothetical protein